MARVFIGVGHGGADPGAVSGTWEEADINLVMALAMRDELERHGVVVGISRVTDENDILTEEISEANAFKPDLAVECHNNAGGGDGFEVYRQTSTAYGQPVPPPGSEDRSPGQGCRAEFQRNQNQADGKRSGLVRVVPPDQGTSGAVRRIFCGQSY